MPEVLNGYVFPARVRKSMVGFSISVLDGKTYLLKPGDDFDASILKIKQVRDAFLNYARKHGMSGRTAVVDSPRGKAVVVQALPKIDKQARLA